MSTPRLKHEIKYFPNNVHRHTSQSACLSGSNSKIRSIVPSWSGAESKFVLPSQTLTPEDQPYKTSPSGI